jgi:hypothetical protein
MINTTNLSAEPDQVHLHRPRDEHFSRSGHRPDARGDVDGKPAKVFAPDIALSSMEPGPNLDTECTKSPQ